MYCNATADNSLEIMGLLWSGQDSVSVPGNAPIQSAVLSHLKSYF